MSEAIDRILDLRRTGFGFLHHHDENDQVIAVQGPAGPRRAHRDRADPASTTHWPPAAATTTTQPSSGARPAPPPPPPTSSPRCSTLLDLPAPETRHAPAFARTKPAGLWLQTDGSSAEPAWPSSALTSCRGEFVLSTTPAATPAHVRSKGGRLGMMVTRSMIERMPP